MRQPRLVLAGALLAGSAVLLGAFGAHGLRDVLTPRQLGWWQTGVQYQLIHGLALIALIGLGMPRSTAVAALLGGGALTFASTLYLMALGGPHWLGAITPFGGGAMIAGWIMLAWQAATGPNKDMR